METQIRYGYDQKLKTGVYELRTLLEALGHHPDLINTHALQEVADMLSRLAELPEGKTWTWKYLNQVLHNKLAASKALYAAIQKQGALSDGVKEIIATSTRVVVYAPKGVQVHAGSLILADSRLCYCGLWFVPRTWNQRDHSPECGKARRKAKA